MNDLVIDLDLLNITKVMQGIDQVIGKIQQMQSQMGRMKSNINNIAKNARDAVGPMQKLAQASRDLQKVMATGTPAQQFDAQYRFRKAQQAYDRAQKTVNPVSQTFGQKFTDMLKTSRMGMSGSGLSIMPLIGKTAALLGERFVLIATVLLVLQQALQHTIETVRNFAQAMFESGATPAEMRGVSIIGGTLGLSPGQVASAARASQQASSFSTGNPFAMQFAARAGVTNIGGPLGNIDAIKDMNRQIELFLRLTNEEAQRMGMANEAYRQFMQLRTLSAADQSLLRQQMAKSQQPLFTPGQTEAVTAFSLQWSILMTNLEQIMGALGEAILPVVTVVLQLINIALKPLIPILTVIGSLVHTGVAFFNFILSWLQRLLDILDPLHLFHGKDPGDKDQTAQDKNTNAINANTHALQNVREIIGGGERARGAIPEAWRGKNLADAMHGNARALGAFAL